MMFLICSYLAMETHRTATGFLTIPPPPRAKRRPRELTGWDALREASLAGMLALAAAWTLAELVVAVTTP
ncbi:hypothetical protein [Siccirubricoccus sp. G192]|uniref:hypothetical protein n=1 Tax=Siccirubricoccus sp. G192 TaxID=2849651 RepID=UPI001C2C55BF|nr:hypothetical protein [Siccirubricoccus sp. G192]MBV1798788.1 hypothetical protein [Siccirubricoccus sp. G192]